MTNVAAISRQPASNLLAKSPRYGFTLIEVLIVILVMVALAGAVIPRFASSTDDAKTSALRSNLHVLRQQIEIYKLQHAGNVPDLAKDTLPQLTSATDVTGATGTSGPKYPFGPYLQGAAMPVNPFDGKSTVTACSDFPPKAATNDGGWLYEPITGRIAANTTDHLTD